MLGKIYWKLLHLFNYKKKEKESEYLIAYADMATLLLAFFIILYAMSSIQK